MVKIHLYVHNYLYFFLAAKVILLRFSKYLIVSTYIWNRVMCIKNIIKVIYDLIVEEYIGTSLKSLRLRKLLD